MANLSAKDQAHQLFKVATPTIRIHSVGGRQWKRKVAKGSRVGPWFQGRYEVLNKEAWKANSACLYLVSGNDSIIRYVGISRNGLKDRWRTSPAYDAQTMQKLPENQIFHSQCWKHIERESLANPSISFEVRVITGDQIASINNLLSAQVASLVQAFHGDGEGIVAGIERWLCNHSAHDLVTWNVAMTSR